MEHYPDRIVKKLLPAVKNAECILRTYVYEDDKPVSFGTFMCDVPYSSTTTWTHFKPVWLGDMKVQYTITYDNRVKNTQCDLPMQCTLESDKWHSLPWPLLGIEFEKDSGFAIKVDYPKSVKNGYLQIILMGYENLFPLNNDIYYLVDDYNLPLYKIYRNKKYYNVFEYITDIDKEIYENEYAYATKIKRVSEYEKYEESINIEQFNQSYLIDR